MKTIYQSLVSVEPFTLIVTILNLFLQLYLIKKFLLDKVKVVLEQRREIADQKIREAEDNKLQAEQIRLSYEMRMQQAQQEAGRIIESAQKDASARSEQILHQAREQAAQIKERTAADIDLARKKLMHEAKNELSDMVVVLAGKVIGKALDQKAHSRLLDAVIDELGDGV